MATAAAAFRFTFPTGPDRHEEAARLLSGAARASGIDALPDAVDSLCRDVDAPRGLAPYGYGADDVDALVAGALEQTRLLAVSPRPATAEDLALIVSGSLDP